MGWILLQVKIWQRALIVQLRIIASRENIGSTRGIDTNQRPVKKKQGQDGENRWVQKTLVRKPKCILWKNNHMLYKWDKYEEMTKNLKDKIGEEG